MKATASEWSVPVPDETPWPSVADLRQNLENIPVMLAVANAEGKIEYVNGRTCEYLGRDAVDVVHHPWIDGIHPDDREAVRTEWSRCIESGRAVSIDHRLRRSDGQFRWFHGQAEARPDARGCIRWYGALTDIDDHRKTEDALRISEQSLRTMLDGIPGMVCQCAADGELEYVNQPMLDLMGHSVEESKRLGWAVNIHPDDRDLLVKRWTWAMQAGQLLEHEYRRQCPDGEYRWFHVRMKPQLDAHDRINRWYALIVDIDDRIKAQEAQRKNENSVWLALESVPIMIWCATATGELSYLNRHLLNYKGVLLDDLKVDQYQLLHPDDREAAAREWRHSIESGEPFSTTLRTRRADGLYRWHRVRAEALRNEHGRIVQWYGIQIDIHEYKTAQDALRFAQARLTRASQAAAVAELSASIAHEVNQPLAAIVANGHACQRWLSAEPPNLDRARVTAAKIVDNANAAGEVISRIRALFRHAPPLKSTLDLNEVIGEVCQLMNTEFQATAVALHVALDRGLPLISADRVQLQQVLENLFHNAVDAMEAANDRLRVLSIRSRHGLAGGVLVEVTDNGMGVDDLERIFEPFVTTKAKGMGMGLAICRSVIEAHNGRLWASRNKGHGATFAFELPIQSPPAGT